MAHNPAEFAANMILIRQILKEPSLAGEFSKLDPEGLMTQKDINKLMKGHVSDSDIKNCGKLKILNLYKMFNRTSNLTIPREMYILRGGLKALIWNKKSYMAATAHNRKISGRETLGKWAVSRWKTEMMQDENFSDMASFAEHTYRTVQISIPAVMNMTKLSGKAVIKSGTIIGNAAINGLYATRNEAAAKAAESLEKGIAGAGRTAKRKMDALISLPKKITNRVENQAAKAAQSGARLLGQQIERLGNSLASTKAGNRIKNSPIYQISKEAGRKTFREISMINHTMYKVSVLPMRFLNAGVDFTKKWVFKPIGVGIGIILFIQLAIAAFMGGIAGSSAAAILVFDTEEHFNNPDYVNSEEMGFQQRYEQSQAEFQAQIDGIINGCAKTLNKKGQRIFYGVNGANNRNENQNNDYVSGVTMRFDLEKNNNLEDILSCVSVIMRQKQSNYHKEALELLDCFYRSSHTYDYMESPLYSCDSGCESVRYFCNEAKENYLSTEMKFAPYLKEKLYLPDREHECEVDRNTEKSFREYAGCSITGICFHNSGSENDNFGRQKPLNSICSNCEPYWECQHECQKEPCFHNCSSTSLGCGGYWYCGGHDHFGCPEGHEAKACFGHVNIEMNIHMKSMEELFELGGIKVDDEEGAEE